MTVPIEERLRTEAARHESSAYPADMMIEAANEIEKLRALLLEAGLQIIELGKNEIDTEELLRGLEAIDRSHIRLVSGEEQTEDELG